MIILEEEHAKKRGQNFGKIISIFAIQMILTWLPSGKGALRCMEGNKTVQGQN